MLIALKQALPSLYQFLQENPHVGVNHRDIQKARVKLWLPVYIGSVTLPKSKKKRVDARPRLSAKRVAWLCFLKTRNGVNVGVELKTDKSRAVHHQFQQGEPIHNTFARLRTASRNPRLLRAVYTGRLHSMPGLYFSALWFKSPSREIFASLVRVGKELKAGGLYTRTEVVAVLKDELSRRKEAHQIILARKREFARGRKDENSQ
ncbi:MAG: hypothetical protein DMG98_17970 [Acidobacteria bacterium]|nr:MAG: hypothetical protein DMG98_17970 [Acidobacteriota bacterium]